MGSEKAGATAKLPTAARRNLKIVIVGGSITGLTLANILERLGIDFVLLEAYDNIAPQVGASIGIFGGGVRVLDQLGAAESLEKMVDQPLDTLDFYIEGRRSTKFRGTSTHFRKRQVDKLPRRLRPPRNTADRHELVALGTGPCSWTARPCSRRSGIT